jgi:hypothetical protein
MARRVRFSTRVVRSVGTRRALVGAVVATLAVGVLVQRGPDTGSPDAATAVQPAARKVGSYTPVTGAIFNRPIGSRWQQYAIFRHVNRAIDSTPSGATIRMAVYSFAHAATADRLVKAYKRGVKVQAIFNDHKSYGPERRLVRVLGSKTSKGSFAKFCSDSCRGYKGNMHQKVFLFSKAGSAQNVVMVGSNNMTANNAVNQWSDIYTSAGDPALYWTYAGVFDQMKQDVIQSQQFITARINSYQTDFYPNPSVVSQETDPVWNDLSQISCGVPAPGYGVSVTDPDGTVRQTTAVRLSHHAWNGDRGIWLARKVAELKRAGCDVRVVYGVGIGGAVKAILENNAIPLKANAVPGKRTHQKVLTVNGTYAGNPASKIVWNGSQNWSDGALKRDDTTLRVDDPTVYDQYNANFEDMWANG